ncbi:MAG: hypothetical protein D6732_06640 [Methanobacteriota archaeon]|nr:MAG: hypothetical protein D6732_06640 [Euryarchaeota archaeon]
MGWPGKKSIAIFETESLLAKIIQELKDYQDEKIKAFYFNGSLQLLAIQLKSDGKTRHQYLTSLEKPNKILDFLYLEFMQDNDPFLMLYIGSGFPQKKLTDLYPKYPPTKYITINAQTPKDYIAAILHYFEPSSQVNLKGLPKK